MPKRIVIVGGGFCGTVLAANLLRRPPGGCSEIVLVERGPDIGRGVAYAVRSFPYLLNVPAGRLSADAGDPLQFLRFAQHTFPDADAESFLPRQLYGSYLQRHLSEAEQAARGVALTRVFGEVSRISRRQGTELLMAEFAGRSAIEAERIILALGNPPPPEMSWAEAVRDHPAYHEDPWLLPTHLDGTHTLLIVGNGLTMADVASALSHDTSRAPQLVTVSRRGLVALPQSTFHAAGVHSDGAGLLECAGSIRRLTAVTRALARQAVDSGGDWRETVTFVRHLVPTIWQRLPDVERRRFVRHVQGHWDVHRHRLPPQLATRIERLRRSGRLQVNAGRIDELAADGDRLRVSWRRRGSAEPSTLTVDAVVNATGPDFVLHRSRDALLQSLRGDGWICEDPLNLGLRTTPQGACIAGDGSVSEQLFYLGPMLRAHHWEATAATELRDHAERLALHLVQTAA